MYVEQSITTNIAHKTKSVESADYPSQEQKTRVQLHHKHNIENPHNVMVCHWLAVLLVLYLGPDWIISKIDLKVSRLQSKTALLLVHSVATVHA